MTELQYNARCNEIESEIKTFDKEMTRLHDEILQSRVTGDYSKVSESLDLFLKKSDRMAELVKERTALRYEKMEHGFDEPESYNECSGCDCYDPDMGCTMSSIDKCYACPMESQASHEDNDITLTLTDEEACLLLQILSEEIDANDHLIETYNRMYRTAEDPEHIKSEEEAVIHERKMVKAIADKVHSLIGGETA